MPDQLGPINEKRETVRFHGAAKQEEESIGLEQRTYVDDERGIVEEADRHVITCASCGSAIRTPEEAGGSCAECLAIIDVSCAKEVRCADPECGKILCREHAMHIQGRYWCRRHGREFMAKPILFGFIAVVAFLIMVRACG